MKKIFIFLFIFLLFIPAAFSKEKQKTVANMNSFFSVNNIPEDINFSVNENIYIDEEITIPEKSVVFVKVINAQTPLRWHKSGFILLKLNNYKSSISNENIDISNKEIYFIAKKYEKIYKKEAILLTTEITLSQAASFFAPGVDILYYFTKGAIKKTTHPHWLKAGISYAYENSIFWFCLKGKSIELNIDDEIEIKKLKNNKFDKINKKIEKRKMKKNKKNKQKI